MTAAPLSWRPPALPQWRALEIAREIRRHREALADLRHQLETYDQGVTDDPAGMAARDLAGTLPELDSATRWLTER